MRAGNHHYLKKSLLAVACAAAPLVASADTAREIADLKARLAALEAKQEEARPETAALSDRIKFSGTLEVEASYTDSDGFSEETASDIVLATAELALEAAIAENVTGIVTLLYEDDGDEELDVDVAEIVFTNVGGAEIVLGQTYVPFGAFETHLVNDTLVLELAETRETVAMATMGNDLVSASVYAFNGDADDDANVERYGASFNLGNEQFSFGIDYLSSIAETDGIFDILEDAGYDPAVADSDEHPEGWILRGKATLANVTFIAEQLQGDELRAADWGLATDIEPKATQLEIGVPVGDWTLATAYQETDELAGLLPEERISIGASTDIAENVSLGIELWQDEDYSLADGGTGEDATSAVVQVAVAF